LGNPPPAEREIAPPGVKTPGQFQAQDIKKKGPMAPVQEEPVDKDPQLGQLIKIIE